MPGTSGRAVSDAFLNTLRFRIDLSGTGSISREAAAGEAVSIPVESGTWSVIVTAFNAASQEIGRAVTSVTVTEGRHIVDIRITVDKTRKDITQFRITSPVTAHATIDQAQNRISVSVPEGTNMNNVHVSLVHTGRAITPNPGKPLDLRSPQTFTVTAEDGTTKEYTVAVGDTSPNGIEIENFNGTGGWWGWDTEGYHGYWWSEFYSVGFDTTQKVSGTASVTIDIASGTLPWGACFGHQFRDNPNRGIQDYSGFDKVILVVKSTITGYNFTWAFIGGPNDNDGIDFKIEIPVANEWIELEFDLDTFLSSQQKANCYGWNIGFWDRWNPNLSGPAATIWIDSIRLERDTGGVIDDFSHGMYGSLFGNNEWSYHKPELGYWAGGQDCCFN